MDAVTVVEDEVRELVRRRGLDPVVDGAAIRRLVEDVVADYEERTLTSALPAITDVRSLTRRVYDAVAGFGPLQAYLDDPLAARMAQAKVPESLSIAAAIGLGTLETFTGVLLLVPRFRRCSR